MIRTSPKFKTLREHVLFQYSSHVDYTSKTIFKVFVSIIGAMVEDLFLTEVEQSGTFYVMNDEYKDMNDHDQFAFFVRLCLDYSKPASWDAEKLKIGNSDVAAVWKVCWMLHHVC